jgi:hypothetical protein
VKPTDAAGERALPGGGGGVLASPPG